MDEIRRYAETVARRLDAQVEAAGRRRAPRAAAYGFRSSRGQRVADLESLDRVADYDAWIARRRATALGMPVAPARIELTVHPELERVDAVFERLFQPAWPKGGATLRYPTAYCETLLEFLQPQLETADLSSTQKAGLLAEWQSRSEGLARESNGRAGVFGVNLPGQGCYLNGWLFNYGRPGRPRECLDDPTLRPRILGTAVHEKWGHGYITDVTALGAEKKALGLHFLELGGRLGQRPVDTPVWSLLIDRYNMVHRVSEFMEEGWSTWVEATVMEALLAQPIRPRLTLRDVWNAVNRAEASAQVCDAALTALRVIFLDERPDGESLHAAVLSLQGLTSTGQAIRAVLDTSLSQAFGQPAPYILGSLMMDRIGAVWGLRGAPVALRIAANLTYGLKGLGTPELERLVWQPRFNPDSRLVALSRLTTGTPGDVRALAQAAREQLNLAVADDLEA